VQRGKLAGRMMRRIRSQEGFTLTELLIAMTAGMVILLAGFGLLETVLKRTGETQLRVEATQRGRQALDVMTRQLRSQVCLNATTPAVAAATPSSVTFYADLSNGTGGPETRVEKRTLSYDPATRTIYETVLKPAGVATAIAYPGPAATRELVRNVIPDPRGRPSIFRYYTFPPATAGSTTIREPSQELVNPDAATIGRIARIDLAFAVTAGTNARSPLTLRDQVYVRAANPNDPAPYPTCA